MGWVTLRQLAELTGGALLGDAEVRVEDALPLQDAGPNCITLVDHPRHSERLARSPAVAALVAQPLTDSSKPQLVVRDVHRSFACIIELLRPTACEVKRGVHVAAWIDPSAAIGAEAAIDAGCSVGANCRIGDRCRLHPNVNIMAGCRLGDDCELFPGVTLYPGTVVGDRVLVHSGAVLGAYGFGYRLENGRHQRTAQLGWVEIADDVEIGACTNVDRGTYGPTKIGCGTKIDNQVQIGHNCQIGRHNLICAQVGIAGSSTTGDHVVLAGQVGIADHIRLADRVVVGAQSGIMQNLQSDAVVLGTPARPSKQTMLEVAHVSRLPGLRKEVRELQKQVAELLAQSATGTGNQVDDLSDRRNVA